MENLLRNWDLIKKELLDKNIFLFLDYDGTLTPIVGRPEDAVLSAQARGLLSSLSNLPSCRVAIISGRSVENIAAMVGLNKLIYAGNHGLEIRGQGVGSQIFTPDGFRDIIKGVRDLLLKACSRFEGVIIEDKGPTLSFHYRMSPEADIALIKGFFKESVKRRVAEGKIRIVEGKKVFEVRPAIDWDKGRAVQWLLDKGLFGDGRPVVPVYIGDDTTDEDAFRVLAGNGLTVWVGQGQKVETDYFLEDTGQVLEFLEKVRFLKIENGK
ncbi:MAG TPA: trehalose-phosphatase [Candidatus Omnitrophica bacterium]|nr:trehalose-phosphatase [Candidatus Omnitrophota bacterium]